MGSGGVLYEVRRPVPRRVFREGSGENHAALSSTAWLSGARGCGDRRCGGHHAGWRRRGGRGCPGRSCRPAGQRHASWTGIRRVRRGALGRTGFAGCPDRRPAGRPRQPGSASAALCSRTPDSTRASAPSSGNRNFLHGVTAKRRGGARLDRPATPAAWLRSRAGAAVRGGRPQLPEGLDRQVAAV